jgi:hypothetical protein
MQLKNVCLAAAIAMVSAAPSMATEPAAPDTWRVGTPVLSGTGCPSGSATAVLTEDGSTVSIFFDGYRAAAGDHVFMDRKACNIGLPIHVPNGLSVALLKLDYRGWYSLPAQGKATLKREYFFAGARGDRVADVVYAGQGEVETSDNLLALAQVYSRCGADTTARVNTSIIAESPSPEDVDGDGKLDKEDEDTNHNGRLDRGEDKDRDGHLDVNEDLDWDNELAPAPAAEITIDTVDATTEMKFHLAWRACR